MAIDFPVAAERYATFRERVWNGSVRVREPSTSGATRDEMELQARWFGGEFGRVFTGTEGEKIEVVQFGHWNRGSGPDFTEAAVRIDGKLRGGAIEIDPDVRDWENHGHGENPNFESTILHVFADAPALDRVYTRTATHRSVPQLQLPQYAWAEGPPDFLPEAFPGRCLAPLASMTDAEVASLLVAASQFRLRRKSIRLGAMASATGEEQSFYQAVAEALGYRSNRTAMAVLAQRCPVSELRAMDPIEREARLFGAAGFLRDPTTIAAIDPASRVYLRGLWERWWKMRDGVEPVAKRAIPWCFSGSRPLNHPQRRVGALAALVDNWEKLRPIWEKPSEKLERLVNNLGGSLSHPYWEHHYTVLADLTPKPLRLIGQDRLRDLLGNVVFPRAIGLDPGFWQEFLTLRKVDTNRDLRRAALRLFGDEPERQKLFTRFYHQQQGLLQIYRDFCLEDLSDCANCPFPEQLSQWRGDGS